MSDSDYMHPGLESRQTVCLRPIEGPWTTATEFYLKVGLEFLAQQKHLIRGAVSLGYLDSLEFTQTT